MAKGDYHVEKKRGAWQVEQETDSKLRPTQVEQLAGRDQAWHIAVFYAKAEKVDVFLHHDGQIEREMRFRPEEKGRRRRR